MFMWEQWACSQVVPLVMQFPKQFQFFGFDHFKRYKNGKIVRQRILIAQKKRPDALIATQKTSSLCKVQFCKKSRKTLKNYPFLQFWPKTVIFQGFSSFKKKIILYKELRFFALHSVDQDASFELSKFTIGQFFRFFTQRGDPYDLGGVKMYPHR